MKEPVLFILITVILLSGCLSIDYSPIEDRPFYLKTSEVFQTLDQERIHKPDPKPIWIGAAKVAIEVPEGIQLAGYGTRRSKPSIAVHGPVYIRALAVQAGKKRIVIVSSGLLAITNEIVDAVIKKVNRSISLTAEDLMITATHTHSGPGGLSNKFWERFATGPYYDQFFESLTEQMAQIILEAATEMLPARMRSARAEAYDFIVNRMTPGGLVDPEIGIIEFQTLDESLRVLLVNFSAHATVLGSGNLLLSGDYPGAIERELEKQPETKVLFTAGAVGDQTSRFPGESGEANPLSPFERIETMGVVFSDRVQKALSLAPWRKCGVVDSLRIPWTLPPTQVRVSSTLRLPSFFGNLFFDATSSLLAIRMGDQILLGVPADLSSELGLHMKGYAKKNGFRLLITGFTNDYVGYIISQDAYKQGAYEARMSFNGPHMASYFEKVASGMLGLLGNSPAKYCSTRGKG